VLALALAAMCRWAKPSRAIAGAESMAAAIIAAEMSLRLVIRFLHGDLRSQSCWLLKGGGEELARLKGTIPHLYSTSCEMDAPRNHELRRFSMKWDFCHGVNRAGARLDAETRALDKRE
jgi:hypothetical protein